MAELGLRDVIIFSFQIFRHVWPVVQVINLTLHRGWRRLTLAEAQAGSGDLWSDANVGVHLNKLRLSSPPNVSHDHLSLACVSVGTRLIEITRPAYVTRGVHHNSGKCDSEM